GTSTVLPAGMVTTGLANLIHVPMSAGLRLAGSRSKAPLGWLNASVPYTANGTVTFAMLVNRVRSVIMSPGGDCMMKWRRLSGVPVGPAGRTDQTRLPSSGGAGLSTTVRTADAVTGAAGDACAGTGAPRVVTAAATAATARTARLIAVSVLLEVGGHGPRG